MRLLVCCLYKEVYIQIVKLLNVCPFDYTAEHSGEWEGTARKPVYHTSWAVEVTSCDRSAIAV